MCRPILVLLLALAASYTAAAAPDLTPDPTTAGDARTERPLQRDTAGGEGRNQEEDTRNLVETVMMVRLTEELQLDDEQTVIMVRRLRQLKDEVVALKKARGELYRQLKDAVRDHAPDADIQARLQALLEHDRKLETFKQDKALELGEGLATRQQAQLYIFLSEFENDMRHLIHRAQDRSGDWGRRNGEWRGRGDGEDSAARDGAERGEQDVQDSAPEANSSQ